VTNFGGTSVSVINTGTNTVVATINAGLSPFGVAVSPDGTRAYVTNDGSNNVSVINTGTNMVVATINVGTNPLGVAVSPDGTRAYVTNGGGTVSVIDTASNTVVATVGVGNTPLAVAFSPDGTKAYVTNSLGNSVSVIDTASSTVVATIAGFGGPAGVAFSPDGTRAYVTNNANGNVSVIDTATNTVVGAPIPAGNLPAFLGICSNGNALLAAGLTFKANTSGALACTLASGPSGASGPVFTGGTLQIAGANITSSLPVTLQSQGGTIDTNGNNATLSGTISGPGTLVKVGAGTLTLTGNNSYQGGTALNAGTLAVGSNTALGTVALTFADGTTLQAAGNGLSLANAMVLNGADTVDTQANALTLAGVLSGTGGLTKIGAGTLTLTGNNSYQGGTALNAGTLAVGSNTALGTGALTFADGTTLQAAGNGLSLANAMVLNGADTVDTQANALTLAGVLSGTGSLVKIGRHAGALGREHLYGGDRGECRHAAGWRNECLRAEQRVHARRRRGAQPRELQPEHRLARRRGLRHARLGDAHHRQRQYQHDLLRHDLRHRWAHQDRQRRVRAEWQQYLQRPDHAQRRHADGERLDRQFGGDGELGRHARRYRDGRRDQHQQRRHVCARQFARHDDGARQSRLPVRRASWCRSLPRSRRAAM
jgi:YVTN family beta-propeller protein/autotransporter-associated beta strand protein